MSRKNGGIIGPANTPVGGLMSGSAGGVWRMNDVLDFVSNSQWPLAAQNIENSCRFNDGDSAYMSRTFGTPTDPEKWTWSCWVKRSALGATQTLISYDSGSTLMEFIGFNSTDSFRWYHRTSSGTVYHLNTNRLFRDTSAWYHLVVAYDSSQSTSSDRVKLYVNGVQETSFATSDYPAQDVDSELNKANAISLYRWAGGSEYFDGYAAENVFIDNGALSPTSFGETNSTTGLWTPRKIGAQFGSVGDNTFYLDFKDSSNFGNDASGKDNDFTVTNLTSTDQSTDTCVENFATLSNLYKQDHAFSEGNLAYTSSASDWDSAPATFGASSGKWYVEAKVTALGGGVTRTTLGLTDVRNANEVAESEFIANFSNGDTVGYYGASANQVYKNGSQESGTWSTFTTNDIIGMYVDLDNGKVYFSKNGSMQNSGDPTSGSTGTGAVSITTGQTYVFGVTGYGGGASQINFGSPPFSISSGNSDPNGYGNFEYDTQNYYALNTSNLNTYG